MTLSIIVHGGAKTITEDKVAANNAGCLAAVEAGWAVLRSGGSAGEAVEVAIRILETDQTFNAGFGATLNSEGEVELDAAMVLSKTAIDFLAGDRHPDEAVQMAIATLTQRVSGEAGCVLVDRHGRVGWAYNSSDMAVAYMTAEMEKPAVFTKKEAESGSKAKSLQPAAI